MHRFTRAEGEALDRFAQALRGLRARSGRTREELARSSGLSASFIKDLEVGVRRPRFCTVQSLANGLIPARGRMLADGSIRSKGDPTYRMRWSEAPEAVATAVFHELMISVEGAIAPSRDELRAFDQLAAG